MARPSRPQQPTRQQQQARSAPAAPNPTPFTPRRMHEVRSPIYAYNSSGDFKRTPQPTHALERRPPAPAGVDPRLTSQGDTSRAHDVTPIVGMAYQTPYNVWALYPA